MYENPLLLLCDRPHEPIFLPKGELGFLFSLPQEFLLDRYKSILNKILSFFNIDISLFGVDKGISIAKIPIPKLDIALSLGRNDNFSLFLPLHRRCSNDLIEKFIGAKNVRELLSLAVYCRDRVNTQMFIYALCVAILHRPDTQHMPIPNLWEVFPDKFIDCSKFNNCKEEAHIFPNGERKAIEIPVNWTASDSDPEHRLAYWREDIGINLHHWHWHLVYPLEGLKQYVDKDRRGELNYYMHHQIMARYNTERLCNGLARTRNFLDLREPITEGYFPKLSESSSGRNWPGRPVNMTLSDLNRPNDEAVFSIADMELYRSRIFEAIETMTVKTENGVIELDEMTGIDILGNLMESSILSANRKYYGDFHNMGHQALAFIHDPDYRFLEGHGAVGEPATAMRDPVFYRWHALVDHAFTLFKDKLPAYTEQKLNFPGVTVQDIHINTPNANPNTLECHWVKSNIDVSRGLDFSKRGAVLVSIQHLDHKAFTYSFTIHNANHRPVDATVRIFIAPKFDEAGKPLSQNDQRMLMIEMDKFKTQLDTGSNVLTRESFLSAVTIPWEATFRNVSFDVPLELNANNKNYNGSNLCGCGWPLHMLVPKGTEAGFPMDLFVMVSDYQFDKVDQPSPDGCQMGVSFCGLRGQKYPDARSMGFPFDRVARPGVKTMNDFLTPNMKLQSITVRFTNETSTRQSGSPSKPPTQHKPLLPSPSIIPWKIPGLRSI